MQLVEGKHNTAKVFTDVVDEKSLQQIKTLCDQEFTSGARIRLMPDVHAGAGCTIGTTMTIKDKIVPNLVGVDIGCGMETLMIHKDSEAAQKFDPAQLDMIIRKNIPCGFDIRKFEHQYVAEVEWDNIKGIYNKHRAQLSLGTLGGGNHFIEADKDEEGNLYIVVHSGSRHAGLEIAEYYQEMAWRQLNGKTKADLDAMISQLKAEGRETEIEAKRVEMNAQIKTQIPKDLAYVSGYLFDDYINDMRIMQHFAMLNRKAMINTISIGLHLKKEEIVDQFTTIHNYIDTENMILRKGAVNAQKGEKLLIPINMRDGSLICLGKGNEDWNCSAPHGAGRVMSRMKAKKELSMEEFKAEMSGIYSTTVTKETLDEAPMAYKTMDDIVANIGPTADILNVIKPIYNFKAAE
ncbi:MAG: RtcB family protein [Spirochaetia bacterium]|nr:RtcB family protein [Spirochaetia bacterium]MDY3722256.1 RtcB family protein [Treponema sp.]MDY5816464.1 RtcB family protein [Treponema sp.]